MEAMELAYGVLEKGIGNTTGGHQHQQQNHSTDTPDRASIADLYTPTDPLSPV